MFEQELQCRMVVHYAKDLGDALIKTGAYLNRTHGDWISVESLQATFDGDEWDVAVILLDHGDE